MIESWPVRGHHTMSEYDKGCLAGLLTQHNAAGAQLAEMQRRLTCSEYHNRRLRVVLAFAAAAIMVLVVVCAGLLVERF